jgi:hypothetical protein
MAAAASLLVQYGAFLDSAFLGTQLHQKGVTGRGRRRPPPGEVVGYTGVVNSWSDGANTRLTR